MDHRMTQKEIDEALVLAMEADKREIERLRAELADSQKLAADRLEEQRQMGADLADIERLRMEKDAKLYAELAASQAREKVAQAFMAEVEAKYRALLTEKDAEAEKYKAEGDMYGWNFHMGARSGAVEMHIFLTSLINALAIPADDTALREMLARAQEEMRERCAKEAHERWIREPDESPMHTIRALEVKP